MLTASHAFRYSICVAKRPTARTRARSAAKPKRRSRVTRVLTTRAAVPKPTRGMISAVQRLFDGIPEPELIAALESSDDDRAFRLLTILRDSAYAHSTMLVKIRAAGMNVPDTLSTIMTMYKSDAALRVARRIPTIMEQMAEECIPHYVPCPKCGLGERSLDTAADVADALTDEPKRVCTRCRGTRSILQPADNDVRKMILENQDLLGTKAPLIDARSVHIHGAPDMTDWSRSSDESMERVPRRLSAREAAVVEVEAEA